jgi:hypothetical protein
MRFAKPFLLSLLVSTQVFAHEVTLAGSIEKNLNAPQNKTNNIKKDSKPHTIKLMKLKLSDAAKKTLSNRTHAAINNPAPLTTPNLPSSVQLGMNDVPVLDQGPFGTCVTFAATAAIDAVLGQGDYISQLCHLQLGLSLEQNGYQPSGWEGSFGRQTLSRIDQFGIINKAQQLAHGCGGLTEYPALEQPGSETAMPIEQFHQISEDVLLNGNFEWSTLLDVVDAFVDRVDTNKTLADVKTAISQGDRVTFAVLLLDFDLGLAGAVGSHHAAYDSWILTPQIARDLYLRPYFGGHEMVITGYDDDAIAVDEQGNEHKGLLTLRNSWSDTIGDKGDFYMSYDYFKVLVIEAQRIRNLSAVGIPAGKK